LEKFQIIVRKPEKKNRLLDRGKEKISRFLEVLLDGADK